MLDHVQGGRPIAYCAYYHLALLLTMMFPARINILFLL